MAFKPVYVEEDAIKFNRKNLIDVDRDMLLVYSNIVMARNIKELPKNPNELARLVRDVQESLAGLGSKYNPGDAEGKFGKITRQKLELNLANKGYVGVILFTKAEEIRGVGAYASPDFLATVPKPIKSIYKREVAEPPIKLQPVIPVAKERSVGSKSEERQVTVEVTFRESSGGKEHTIELTGTIALSPKKIAGSNEATLLAVVNAVKAGTLEVTRHEISWRRIADDATKAFISAYEEGKRSELSKYITALRVV